MRILLALVLAGSLALSFSILGPASVALADPGPGNRGIDVDEEDVCEVDVGGFEFEVAGDEVTVEIFPGVEVELDELGLFPFFFGFRQFQVLRAARLAVLLCGFRGFDFEDDDD